MSIHDKVLLISNSIVYGRGYLDHVESEIKSFLGNARRVLFFPFAFASRDRSWPDGEEDVYAELCEIVAGQKTGRVADDEIIVSDSTRVAIEDAASAAAVYERALANSIGNDFIFAI